MNKIILPGEKVSDKPEQMPGTYIHDGKTYADVISLYDEEGKKSVPLEGMYLPRAEDYIVGVVCDVRFAGYNINIAPSFNAFLSGRESRDKFELGDVVFAKIAEVDEVNSVALTDARRLTGGKMIEVSPVKIPRVIGKKNSMVNMIIDSTKSEVYIGRNGRIWMSGGDIELTVRAIQKVEQEAHVSGLTDRVKKFLEDEAESE
ncbi:Exosome complex component Rrp4 [Candidatus Gugararchaeum adminiculabundum]|nr:Exosome complex component Rrp4 [Candidatus Gugararchaeum adminiculabundum]